LSQVPDAVVKAVADGDRLGIHALLRHAGHHSPGRPHPGFLGLGGAGIDVPRRGHDVHHAVGTRVELGPVVVVNGLPSADRLRGGNDVGKPAGLGIPLPAQLVAHDPGHAGDSTRPTPRIDVVIIPRGIPKVGLKITLAQRQPGLIGIRQHGITLGSGDLLGGLAGRQVKASAIGSFTRQPQVVIGLVDTAGNRQVVGDPPGDALAVDLGHGHLNRRPAIVKEGGVG
jgi:hypothetical protein